MKNELINLSLPPRELSCLVGNLFAELEPPCGQDLDPEGLILCGRTPAGREAMLLIGADRCTFIGNAEDYNAARNGRCPSRRCSFGG
jgi:hypothetical protein